MFEQESQNFRKKNLATCRKHAGDMFNKRKTSFQADTKLSQHLLNELKHMQTEANNLSIFFTCLSLCRPEKYICLSFKQTWNI